VTWYFEADTILSFLENIQQQMTKLKRLKHEIKSGNARPMPDKIPLPGENT